MHSRKHKNTTGKTSNLNFKGEGDNDSKSFSSKSENKIFKHKIEIGFVTEKYFSDFFFWKKKAVGLFQKEDFKVGIRDEINSDLWKGLFPYYSSLPLKMSLPALHSSSAFSFIVNSVIAKLYCFSNRYSCSWIPKRSSEKVKTCHAYLLSYRSFI